MTSGPFPLSSLRFASQIPGILQSNSDAIYGTLIVFCIANEPFHDPLPSKRGWINGITISKSERSWNFSQCLATNGSGLKPTEQQLVLAGGPAALWFWSSKDHWL
jgi:hypothetical protein